MKVTEDLLKDALRYGKAFTKFGKTAQYIPELRAVNQYYLGVCTIDLEGNGAGGGGYPYSLYDTEYFEAGVPDPGNPGLRGGPSVS